MHLDKILDQMRFTWVHYVSIFAMATTNIVTAFNTLMTSMLISNVQHECRLISPNETAVGECHVFRNGSSEFNETVPCENGYQYTYHKLEGTTNILTQWDLVCDKKYTLLNITTVYFSGILLGSIVFGLASDHFGRKRITLLCLIGALSTAWASCFVTNLIVYTVLYWFSSPSASCSSCRRPRTRCSPTRSRTRQTWAKKRAPTAPPPLPPPPAAVRQRTTPTTRTILNTLN